MKSYVKYQSLPHNAETVILGGAYREVLDKPLRNLDLKPLYVPPNHYVDKRLSSHADLSVLHLGNNKMLAAPYLRSSEFANKITELGINISFSNINQSSKYPFDTQLNICAVGKKVFYSKGISTDEIYKFYDKEQLLDIKQGYCKCSICVVSEDSIITSDSGAARAAGEHGIDALLIKPGFIELGGFEYGFIGGSAFKLSDDTLVFTGKINKHPDNDRITKFLDAKHIKVEFLTERDIFDVGSIIPITEK